MSLFKISTKDRAQKPGIGLDKNIPVKSGDFNPVVDEVNRLSAMAPSNGVVDADTITEFTSGAGTTINGVLIKNGAITSSGFFVGLILDSAEQSLSGPGAVNVTAYSTRLTTIGANAFTLADGNTVGQLKEITLDVDGGDGTLTPTTGSGFTTITFNDAADNVLLIWTAIGWRVIRNFGCTVA